MDNSEPGYPAWVSCVRSKTLGDTTKDVAAFIKQEPGFDEGVGSALASNSREALQALEDYRRNQVIPSVAATDRSPPIVAIHGRNRTSPRDQPDRLEGRQSNRGGPSPEFPRRPLAETPAAPDARIGPLPRCKREPGIGEMPGLRAGGSRMGDRIRPP